MILNLAKKMACKIRKGFTMPEMILYIGLTSVLMVALMNAMLTVLEHDKITTDREAVQQEVRVAIDQVLFDLREADSVDTVNSVLDDDNGTLVLNFDDTSRDPTEITISNGVIVRRRGVGVWQQLTGDDIKVTSLRFEKKVPLTNPSIISVDVTASELYSSESPLETLPITLQDSATIRKQFGKVDPRDFNGSSISSINPYFDISSSSSVLSTCGNGELDAGEECDDGNTDNGDTCSSDCLRETVTVDINYCPATAACDNHPGPMGGTCPPGPLNCSIPNDDWDCNWQCPDDPLGQGIYDRCIYAYQCACDKGGGPDTDVTSYINCYDNRRSMFPSENPSESYTQCSILCVADPLCGNGILNDGEECDGGGNTASCDDDCTLPVCGDGVWNNLAGEECDDGNGISGDGCYQCELEGYCCTFGAYICTEDIGSNCTGADKAFYLGDGYACYYECYQYCGNGYVDVGEECDDGNWDEWDGCSYDCTLEYCCDTSTNTCSLGVGSCNEYDIYSDQNYCEVSCAVCGDGTPAGNEECDDGGSNSDTTPDACRTSCLDAYCGDGVVDTGEICDEGGNTATCDNDCTAPNCGDGIVNIPAGEECDDGNSDPDDGCFQCQYEGYCCELGVYTCTEGISGDCTGATKEFYAGGSYYCDSYCSAWCGNGFVDAGEECDDGNWYDWDSCSSNCKLSVYCCEESMYGGCYGPVSPDYCSSSYVDEATCNANCSVCGNGVAEPGEECDDGNWDEGDGCDYCMLEYCCDTTAHTCSQGIVGCDYYDIYGTLTSCDIDCAFCGDGVLAGLEECDDGGSNSDTTPNACRTSCLNAYCGDSVVDNGEICDEGGNTATCDNNCTAPVCGDGIANIPAGEECDDGNLISGDGCSDQCKNEGYCCTYGAYTCVQDVSSNCIGGNQEFFEYEYYGYGYEECDWECHAWCGNGYLDTNEDCDDGNYNNGDGCTYSCTEEYCCRTNGTCDTASPATCNSPGEVFYSGAWAQTNCTNACDTCGDGITDAGEECDDGNSINTDACLNSCANASCGDGYVQSGVEECDDSNLSNSDACLNSCEDATCGDGYIRSGIEECDDGNGINGDGCSECTLDVYCCDDATANCSTSKVALSTCTSSTYNTDSTSCEAECGVIINANFCPVNSCFGYPGNSTYCSNPVSCGIVGQAGWDCNWNCNGAGALDDGNYARCIGAYKCACMMGGGDRNVADFLGCYASSSNDMTLLESCLLTHCN